MIARQRLRLGNIQRRAGDLAMFQRLHQRSMIHHTTAGH